MREIIFRGKMDDGEWVYGSFCMDAREQFNGLCGVDGFIRLYDKAKGKMQTYEVDRETVGQYTGLKDKNGKRIFEGDMIKPFDDEVDKMVVEFHNGQFLLCLYGERGYMAEYGWEEEGNYGCFEAEPLSSYGDDIEVIDNIHDNPELMEEENNETD